MSPSPVQITTVGSPTLRATLTSSGELQGITASDDIQVTQYVPSSHDLSTTTVFLRFLPPQEDLSAPIVIRLAGSGIPFSTTATSVTWEGKTAGVVHRCTLALNADQQTWAWKVQLTAQDDLVDQEADLLFSQDISLAPAEAAMASEAYVAQYLAQKAVQLPRWGYTLLARQSMAALPDLPLLITGILEGARAYKFDAIDVFGPGARINSLGLVLTDIDWESVGRQFEIPYPTLATNRFTLRGGETVDYTAVSRLIMDYSGPLDLDDHEIEQLLTQAASDTAEGLAFADTHTSDEPAGVSLSSDFALLPLATGQPLTEEEFRGFGHGTVLLPEYNDAGDLTSYFTQSGTHVVSGAKEASVERPHGDILRSGPAELTAHGALSATTYASGVFLSHIAVGNTNFNRLVSVHRHPLNLLRSSGVRVIATVNGKRYLLGIPSAILFHLGGVRWIYQLKDRRITVEASASADSNQLTLRIVANRPTDIITTWDIEKARTKDGSAVEIWEQHISNDGLEVRFTPGSDTDTHHAYPDLEFRLRATSKITADICEDGFHETGLLSTSALNSYELTMGITGSLIEGAPTPDLNRTYKSDVAGIHDQLREVLADFSVFTHPDARHVTELHTLIPWYTHNTLVHFLTPHGLEQYSGAAWGTRDVLQGPLEFWLSFGHFDMVRTILLTVFGRQFEAGNFPQWFMFDRYQRVYLEESHGDVAVWPLFAVAQYLQTTGDLAFLEQKVPFWNREDKCPEEASATIRDHLLRELEYLRTNELAGTHLPQYGHGDWDDTLQPTDPDLRTRMTSAWTAALLIQALRMLATDLEGSSETALLTQVRDMEEEVFSDYQTWLLPDGQIAGYMVVEDEGPRYLLHPRDEKTGITARLIPMTQSIIGGLLDDEQTASHMELIRSQLLYPHGTHLMDRFAPYTDGRSSIFLRAEQAAMVGREVGLMYTHAHIRYVEALAALGDDRALDELLRVSPFDDEREREIHEPRQRNTFYSSSDAAFADRHEAAVGLARLASGEVKSRGGWRIYSSGPGIFLRQLVQGILGISLRADRITLSPTLAKDEDGLTITVKIAGHNRTIRYVAGKGENLAVATGFSFEDLEPLDLPISRNRYGKQSIDLAFNVLEDRNYIEIHYPTA